MNHDQTDTWKFFDQNPLTHSAAHYLMTIHELHDEQGYARITDIANKMDISPSSCSISIKALKKKRLVEEDKNKFLKLSARGEKFAKLIAKNAELLIFLFHNILGVDAWQSEVDACKIEHLLSIESSLKLAEFVDLVQEKTPDGKSFLKELHKRTSTIDTE